MGSWPSPRARRSRDDRGRDTSDVALPFSFRVALLASLLVLPLLHACERKQTEVTSVAIRLTEELAGMEAGALPFRCRIDEEIRPSFGCPVGMVLVAEATPVAEESLRVSVEIPPPFRGKPLAVTPRIVSANRMEAYVLEEEFWPSSPERASWDFPDLARVDRSRLDPEIVVYPIPGKHRVFETRSVSIPAAATLTFALGLRAFAEDSGAGPVAYRIIALEGGRERVLFSEEVELDADDRWLERKIDLAELGGREVRLRFETTNRVSAISGGAIYGVWGSPQIEVRGPRAGRRNVVVLSLDTLRADHVGREFEGRALTPWLDRLGAEGASFDLAMTTYPSTTASHMSLLTGAYPNVHESRYPTSTLRASMPTLPQRLAEAGWRTGAVTENAMLLAEVGFSRGFDEYRENRDVLEPDADGIDRTFAEAIAWLEENPETLFFLFVHTYEVHTPYRPAESVFRELSSLEDRGLTRRQKGLERMLRSYAAGVHYADRAVEKLFADLDARGLLEDTLVVITSDHGEEFGEHGLFGHARSVWDPVLHIPLILWSRDGAFPAGTRIAEVVSLVDVAPTLLDFLGLEPLEGVSGQSLRPLLGGARPGPGRVRYAEADAATGPQVAARTSQYKWIFDQASGRISLFDLLADPGETSELSNPALESYGRGLIEAYLRRGRVGVESRPDFERLDARTRQKLEALGYVE
jgi:arylsulfatase A-like enzyme